MGERVGGERGEGKLVVEGEEKEGESGGRESFT